MYGLQNNNHPGNDARFSFDRIIPLPSSPLAGKHICVLGSSVVYGLASNGQAVAEYLGRRFCCTFTKEAKSGTTLADISPSSYISRMKNLDSDAHFDFFLCQLSTNDATHRCPLGEISESGSFDTSTVTGAIEYIIQYVRNTWHCPLAFFTGSRYESVPYDAMVLRLKELQAIYGIGVLDLWTDPGFNDLPDDLRSLYMYDNIHPTMAGYRDYWGPELERQLLAFLATDVPAAELQAREPV